MKIMFGLMMVSSIANAATMMKCVSSEKGAKKAVMSLQFDAGNDASSPRNMQALLLKGGKTSRLSLMESSRNEHGFFLNDVKTRRIYFVSEAMTVQCTEPKMAGMLLPCSDNASFKCKLVNNL